MQYFTLVFLLALFGCDASTVNNPLPPKRFSGSNSVVDSSKKLPEDGNQEQNDSDQEPEQPGFVDYRIKILEMANACPGNAVNISSLKFMEDGKYLEDSFKTITDETDLSLNVGTIGDYHVSLSTSGDYLDFYPFEAFGGGFGAGWWSKRDSFSSQAPYNAESPVWFQVSFGGERAVIDKIYLKGGTTIIGDQFRDCAPSHVQILGSNNQGRDWVILSDERINSKKGTDMSLSPGMARTLY